MEELNIDKIEKKYCNGIKRGTLRNLIVVLALMRLKYGYTLKKLSGRVNKEKIKVLVGELGCSNSSAFDYLTSIRRIGLLLDTNNKDQ